MQDLSKFGPLVADLHGEKSLSTDRPAPETLPTGTYEHKLGYLPSDPVKARAQVERWLKDAETERLRHYDRYNKLREQGQAAVSNYDIDICARGNAEVALAQALELKTAHIIAVHTRIVAYNRYLCGEMEGVEIQLSLF